MDPQNGLVVTLDGKPSFDSRKSHLIVPGTRKPVYLGVTTITAAPITVVAGIPISQVVLTIVHGLGYAPFIDCYFYPTSAQPTNPDQYFQITDTYWKNFFTYINPSGLVQDVLTVKVDDVKVTVTHTYSNPGSGGTDAPFPVNMKYTIYANPGYLQP